MKLPLDRIRAEDGTQTRASMSDEAVHDYAEAMRAGAEFPAVVVFHDDDAWWLSDGFHRYAAAKRAGLKAIEADVRRGGKRDALLHALAANTDHGVRRTNADKARAVQLLLADAEWSQWSDEEIGRRCRVAGHTVGDWRRRLNLNSSNSDVRKQIDSRTGAVTKKRVGKRGRTRRRASQSLRQVPERDEAATKPVTLALALPPEFADPNLVAGVVLESFATARALLDRWPASLSLWPLIGETRRLLDKLETAEAERERRRSHGADPTRQHHNGATHV